MLAEGQLLCRPLDRLFVNRPNRSPQEIPERDLLFLGDLMKTSFDVTF